MTSTVGKPAHRGKSVNARKGKLHIHARTDSITPFFDFIRFYSEGLGHILLIGVTFFLVSILICTFSSESNNCDFMYQMKSPEENARCIPRISYQCYTVMPQKDSRETLHPQSCENVALEYTKPKSFESSAQKGNCSTSTKTNTAEHFNITAKAAR